MKVLTAFAIIVSSIIASPAYSNVIYDFKGDASDGLVNPFTARLIVTDDAVQSGQLRFNIKGTINDFTGTGDYSGLVSFTDNQRYRELFTPSSAWGVMSLDVVFPKDGSLSGTLSLSGIEQDFFLSGSGSDWVGSFNADWAGGCWNRCSLTGYWVDPPGEVLALSEPVDIPEGPTLPLYGVALVLLGLGRKIQQGRLT